MENKPNIWIIILTSLLIIVMMIPITALVITPSKEPQPLDTPLFELNNHSLREVFEEGNELINFYNEPEWGAPNTESISIGQNSISLQGSSAFVEGYLYYFEDIVVENNDKIYLKYKWESNDIINTDIFLFATPSIILIENITSKNYSNIVDVGNRSLITQIRFDINNVMNEYQQTIYKPYFINMNSFGISTLTVEQMDRYYNLYQYYKDLES